MSRVAKSPVTIPSGVTVEINGQELKVKGSKGVLERTVNAGVEVKLTDNVLTFSAADADGWAMAGTTRSLVDNMVKGVSEGFEKKLQLVGVGYRAKVTGDVLNLQVGYSNPIDYTLPEGISAETPTQTEIVVKGMSKQAVGQVASEIRAFRPPEPYKGKGIRYANEQVRRKEAKKK